MSEESLVCTDCNVGACKCTSSRLPVRGEPLLAVYERFKHLDRVFEMVQDSDGTENTDPFHPAARDMWRAIKASVGGKAI